MLPKKLSQMLYVSLPPLDISPLNQNHHFFGVGEFFQKTALNIKKSVVGADKRITVGVELEELPRDSEAEKKEQNGRADDQGRVTPANP